MGPRIFSGVYKGMDYGMQGGAELATAPPVKKGHLKLYLILAGVVVGGIVVAIVVNKMRSKTPSKTTMDSVNAATSGTPQVAAVSAAAAGAAAASGSGPAAASTSLPAAASSSSYAPVTAPQSVAASSATPVATSASTVAAPTVAPSAPSASPLFVAYKNMTTPGPNNSGLCIDAGGPFNSAALYWCWGGTPQQWSVDSSSGNVAVKSSGNCLASSDSTGASGSSVTTKACDKSDVSQLWDWVNGAFKLRGTSQCADSTTLGNGARMTMQPCSGAPSQSWSQG